MKLATPATPAFSVFNQRRRSDFGLPPSSYLLPDGDGHDDDTGDGQPAPPKPADKADKGYPADTPLAEMTPEQQVAYWKAMARKHEQRSTERADYEDLKAKAAEYDKAQLDALPAQERAATKAREEGIKEGRTQALIEANKGAVTALMDGALRGRGKTDEQVTHLLRHFNAESFVVDGQPDTKAILSLADSIAGPVTGGGKGPDFGQGTRHKAGQSRADLGKAEAARRFAKSG